MTQQIWFLTGSQHLYGPEVLDQVTEHSRVIAEALAASDDVPVQVVPRPVLTETDAPYLTPVPLRGRPNASYLVPHTVRFLAAAREVDLATLCAQLDANAEAAFGGAW